MTDKLKSEDSAALPSPQLEGCQQWNGKLQPNGTVYDDVTLIVIQRAEITSLKAWVELLRRGVANPTQEQLMDEIREINSAFEEKPVALPSSPAPTPNVLRSLAIDVVDAIEWLDQGEPKFARDVLGEIRDKLRALADKAGKATPVETASRDAAEKKLFAEFDKKYPTVTTATYGTLMNWWQEKAVELESQLTQVRSKLAFERQKQNEGYKVPALEQELTQVREELAQAGIERRFASQQMKGIVNEGAGYAEEVLRLRSELDTANIDCKARLGVILTLQSDLDDVVGKLGKAEAENKALRDALEAGKTRYSRDRGMPEPTPSFPTEVVFTMPQWHKVLAAFKTNQEQASEGVVDPEAPISGDGLENTKALHSSTPPEGEETNG